ncbi:hypothetical protein BMF94_0080 [Rhodotorula taiwanensis]|uniref:XLF-like N-terminal domain-containing protein n=1 Tax=Rhodotorula taiwanensis TaxID=741276 RepID=A0A2S5BJ94_9BASI|nr:hypothetical protein BMF94_0080 [Rhodotorula taiwanensis]
MEWDELNRLFLPVPWTSFPSEDGPLLLKLLYQTDPNQLAIMATDLQNVYFESLNSRQTNRRFEDALAADADTQSQTQSQDVMVGIGDEGEKLLHHSVEKLLSSHLVAITTPSGLVVRFLTTSLETASAAALAAHLVSPLLGVCSGLLSLLREHSDDDSALCRRIEGAIDASGNAERIRDGRSAETFAKVGGPALLGRWIQRSTGARDKDVLPVSLCLPSRPARPFSPMSASASLGQASRTPLRRRSPPPPRQDDHILTPPSAQPLRTTRDHDRSPAKASPSGLARKMLDHDTSARGERIAWDDSQSQPTPFQPARGNETGSTTSPRASDDENGGEHEPSTEDEDVPMLPPRLTARMSEPPGSSPPPTAVKPDLSSQPTPSPEEQAKVQEEKAQWKKASEKVAEEARRRERLKRLPPAGGSAFAAAAKKKRRL